MLRIDVLDTLQALDEALAAREQVAVHEQVVLALVRPGVVEHRVDQLREGAREGLHRQQEGQVGRAVGASTRTFARSGSMPFVTSMSVTCGIALAENFWYRSAYKIASRSLLASGTSRSERRVRTLCGDRKR